MSADIPDAELMTRYRVQRSNVAFRELVARHGGMVVGVCKRILGNSSEAEDAGQEVFILLARRAADIRNPEQVGAWLFGVARRVAWAAERTRLRRQRREEDYMKDCEIGNPRAGMVDTLGEELDDAISKLSPMQRSVVVACYLEGRTYAEAANVLRLPVNAVQWNLQQARTALRSKLTAVMGAGLSVSQVDAALQAATAPSLTPTLVNVFTRESLAAAANASAGSGMTFVHLLIMKKKLLIIATVLGLLAISGIVMLKHERASVSLSSLISANGVATSKEVEPRESKTKRERSARVETKAKLARYTDSGEFLRDLKLAQTAVNLEEEVALLKKMGVELTSEQVREIRLNMRDSDIKDYLTSLFQVWVKADPEALMSWLAGVGETGVMGNSDMQKLGFLMWTDENPQAAKSYAQKNSTDKNLLASLEERSAFRGDPVAIADASLLDVGEQARRSALNNLGISWPEDRFDLALQWSENGIPEEGERIFFQSWILHRMAAKDVKASIKWLERFENGTASQGLRQALISSLARRAPEEAIRLLEPMKDEARIQAVRKLAEGFREFDADRALKWLNGLSGEDFAGAVGPILVTLPEVEWAENVKLLFSDTQSAQGTTAIQSAIKHVAIRKPAQAADLLEHLIEQKYNSVLPSLKPNQNGPWEKDLAQTIETIVSCMIIQDGVGSAVEWVMARPFGDATDRRRFAWNCLRRGLVYSPDTTRAYVRDSARTADERELLVPLLDGLEQSMRER